MTTNLKTNITTNLMWEKVVDQAKAGNVRQFEKALLKLFENKAKGPLIKLTGSSELAWEVYSLAISKFWEKFVVESNELPSQNIEGYIYNMARNAHFDLIRKQNKKKQIDYKTIDFNEVETYLKNNYSKDLPISEETLLKEQDVKLMQFKALENALKKLCKSCQLIFEKNFFEGKKLKEIHSEINYGGTYQAIVKKKNRCVKKLTRYFFEELYKIKNHSND